MVLIYVLLSNCHAAWGFHQDKANTLVDNDKFLNLYTGQFKDLFPHNEMVRLQAATLTSFYIDSSMVCKFNKKYKKSLRNSMFFNDSTPLEVFDLLNKLKNSCSTGNVDIPNQFLKLITFPLSYILSHLINRSLSSGIMPTLLKVGKQTPVFKGGEVCFSNHRPITVVNSFSKIFEKIAASRLINYLDRFNILNNRQFGFLGNTTLLFTL